MTKINLALLDYLLKLAKIKETDSQRREKLLTDLSKILDYFNQLEEVNTQNVEPLAGGTFLANVFRLDEPWDNQQKYEEERTIAQKQFPCHQNSYLKIPSVFEEDN